MSSTGDSPDSMPPYVNRDVVAGRLQMIFPQGSRNRTYCVREMAASTVFAMLYIGAIEATGVYLAPKHIYRMTVDQALSATVEERRRYRDAALRPGFSPAGTRWYADNTREPIRDETLREGLVQAGAVVLRLDLPTTSSKPRYALRSEFAALFDPRLTGEALEDAIEQFQHHALSKGALARVAIVRHGAARGGLGYLVAFPNGETRQLSPGVSSAIAKAVVEVFATRFLVDPAVLSLSESGNKVVARDEKLAASIGLTIEVDKNLPDIILVDLARNEPLLIFVEVVATDGPMTERRRDALLAQTDAAGFDRSRVAFVTAYDDREAVAFRRTIGAVAWGSFVWFASEPENLLVLRSGGAAKCLDELL